ncbi:hypothetical protein L6164_025143 [Bauhinia variegata]|uniref:Uncharacterized protein n=1 Tax=Bauhinia variegata TaxID=167791 RepID=A0ACB9LZP5_BAUVA|nr:hypothetical protein L6164_025143 [Bauhinia variegata]
MQKNTPVRKPHTNTSDLLTWSEVPPVDSAATVSGSGNRSASRSNQPPDKISKVLHGDQVTDEEAESLVKNKPCSDYKMKEMTGSGIFSGKAEDGASDANSANSKSRTTIRMVQQATNGISQISFSAEEKISPKKPTSIAEVTKQRELSGTLQSESDTKIKKKPTTIPEVAKQRELSGTLQSESDTKTKKQISNAKSKELSGNDIFGPPPEIVPRSLAAQRTSESKESKDMGEPVIRNVRTSVKVSNPAGGQSNILFGEEPVKKTVKKIHNQKFAELTGNNIFNGDVTPGSAEKPLSRAKLREMTGSNIFADGKAETREYARGARRPPGGESSIALV